MNLLPKVLSALGLAITLFVPLFTWWGWARAEHLPTAMVVGMVLWFAGAPFWIKKEGGQEGA